MAQVTSPKRVDGMEVGSIVTIDVWAQITTVAGTGVFGYQNSVFDVLSSNGGSIKGNVGLFSPIAPWNSASAPGLAADLDADGDLDNGTNSTSSSSNEPKGRSDNTAAGGGDPAFANAQTTAVHVAAADFQPITIGAINESGFQFKIGTITFTMTTLGLTDPNVPIGIDPRAASTHITTPAIKAASASFVQGGLTTTGSTGVFRSGGAVQLSVLPAIPEPSAFGMVLLGAMGLVGLRRAGVKRS